MISEPNIILLERDEFFQIASTQDLILNRLNCKHIGRA